MIEALTLTPRLVVDAHLRPVVAEAMVGLAVTFDLGRYHAAAWDTHVNEGVAEWPPSPWRILRAIYSAGHTDTRLASSRDALRDVLARLVAAGPPCYELPAATAAHTRHYVPLAGHSPTAPEKTSLLIDAFLALSPSDELRVWWEVELTAEDRAVLDHAAASVGSLGRSESVCKMRLLEPTAEPNGLNAVPASRAGDFGWGDSAARVDVLMVDAQAGDPVSVLETSITDIRKSRMLAPSGTHKETYAVAEQQATQPAQRPSRDQRPTLAHLRLSGNARPAFTDAVTVGHLARAALQRRFDTTRDGTRSTVLSGHNGSEYRREQHSHAHYLVGVGADRRRVDHVYIWAPEGFGQEEIVAIAGLTELHLRDAPEPIRLALVALGRPDQLAIPGVLGPSRAWTSVTPMALTRHPKHRGGVLVDSPREQVLRELEHRGLPEPETVEIVQGRWMDFTRTRPGQSRRTAATVIGARLQFPAPVTGPIALGGLSHFGLGLFEPAAS